MKLSGYHRHLKSEAAPAPLTMQEEELAEIKRTEVKNQLHVLLLMNHKHIFCSEITCLKCCPIYKSGIWEICGHLLHIHVMLGLTLFVLYRLEKT